MSAPDLITEAKAKLVSLPSTKWIREPEGETAGTVYVSELGGEMNGIAIADGLLEHRRAIADFIAASPRLIRELIDRVKEAEADLAQLRAERAWQPIETAPKDGSVVLVFDASWCGGPPRMTVTRWYWERSRSGDDANWVDRGSWSGVTKATHWQALPSAPSAPATLTGHAPQAPGRAPNRPSPRR